MSDQTTNLNKAGGRFRDRIVEIKTIKCRELLDHQGNWRVHPGAQRAGLIGVLNEIGKADVLKAYYSEREGGALTLIDGHLRKNIDPEEEWHVAILDLNDAEADKMILLYDPLSAMAEMNRANVLKLMETARTDDLNVREILRKLELQARSMTDDDPDGDSEGDEREKPRVTEMDLMPFEHYDYVLMMFRNELDWISAVDVLGLERQADPRQTGKIGLARVVDGHKVIS